MGLFNVRLKNPKIFAQIEKEIIKDIEGVLGGKDMLNEVGEFAADRVRYQARVSKPFNSNGSLPQLKESTVKSRRYIAKHNKTHDTYEESRSNLTITGQLLDSIVHTIVGIGKIQIGLSGMHKGYLSGTGKRGKDIKNETLKGYLEEIGFVIFDKSIETNTVIKSRAKTIVLRFIRRALAIRNRLATK